MSQATEMRFSYEALDVWGRKALAKTDMSQAEIDAVMQVLLATNLQGRDTHGIHMVTSYAERYKSIPHREIQVIEDRGAGCMIDGGNHTGPMTSLFALDKAMEKADQFGIGMSVVGESCHNGAIGYYCQLAAEKGYIALSATTVMPLIAPWGGLETFLGNNPFALAFPYKEMPIVLDIAMTVAARQKIFSYAREGKKIPDGWAMDKDGNPTNDPNEAIEGLLMPVGGHKGAGICLMIDLILGSLTGAYSRAICANTVTDREQHIAHLFFLINPDFYVARDVLDQRVAQYVEDFRKLKKKADVEELLLPGQLEWKTTQDRLANGIPISAGDLKKLNDYADAIGIDRLA